MSDDDSARDEDWGVKKRQKKPNRSTRQRKQRGKQTKNADDSMGSSDEELGSGIAKSAATRQRRTSSTSSGKGKAMEGEKEKLYCICQKPSPPDDPEPMIQCDTCNEWYHFKCVGLQFREEDAQQLEAATYECDTCAEARLARETQANGMAIQDPSVVAVPMQQQQIPISYGNCKQCGATVVITDASEPCCLCKNQSRDFCQNCFAMQECVQCSKVACSLCRQGQKSWSAKCTGSGDCASRFCEDCQRQDSKGEYKCVGCGNCQCDDSSQHPLLARCSVNGCTQVACGNCVSKVFTPLPNGQFLCAVHKDAAGGGSAPQVQPPVQQQAEVPVVTAPVEAQQAPATNGAPAS